MWIIEAFTNDVFVDLDTLKEMENDHVLLLF